MATLVIMVLDDVNRLDDVIMAWQRAGSAGITVIESLGAGRLMARSGARDDLPLFPGLISMLTRQEIHHRTMFTVLGDDVDVQAFFDATEAVTGPLDSPNSGVIFAVPVSAARGHRKRP